MLTLTSPTNPQSFIPFAESRFKLWYVFERTTLLSKVCSSIDLKDDDILKPWPNEGKHIKLVGVSVNAVYKKKPPVWKNNTNLVSDTFNDLLDVTIIGKNNNNLGRECRHADMKLRNSTD